MHGCDHPFVRYLRQHYDFKAEVTRRQKIEIIVFLNSFINWIRLHGIMTRNAYQQHRKLAVVHRKDKI
jgi:hypothetical protein